ncbi:MAG: CapA family protein, partial [Micromonosporaceae bacterium]
MGRTANSPARPVGSIVALCAAVLMMLFGVMITMRTAAQPAAATAMPPAAGSASAITTLPDVQPHRMVPPRTTPVPPPRTLTILGAGDVLLHSFVWRQAAADADAAGGKGYDFGPIFAGVAGRITAADLAICHLETPLAPLGGPYSEYPPF